MLPSPVSLTAVMVMMFNKSERKFKYMETTLTKEVGLSLMYIYVACEILHEVHSTLEQNMYLVHDHILCCSYKK